jgi:hypothetical protein
MSQQASYYTCMQSVLGTFTLYNGKDHHIVSQSKSKQTDGQNGKDHMRSIFKQTYWLKRILAMR